jgi:hypothetical protein
MASKSMVTYGPIVATDQGDIMNTCRTPGCDNEATMNNKWCGYAHYGMFPHKCEHSGCGHMVPYDDEPWCYSHSPDEGSSVQGYSASDKAVASQPIF